MCRAADVVVYGQKLAYDACGPGLAGTPIKRADVLDPKASSLGDKTQTVDAEMSDNRPSAKF